MLRKRLCSLTMSTLVFIAILNVAMPVSAAPATLHVGTGYPYADIQDAINNAAGGDTIIVHPGTYDPIIIDRKLTIKGINAIIEGGVDYYGYRVGVLILANGVVFCGFTIENSGDRVSGIEARNDNIRIMNNVIHVDGNQFAYGIFTNRIGPCISNNKIRVEGYYQSVGIYSNDDNAQITRNDIISKADPNFGNNFGGFGIYIYMGDGAYISNNKIDTDGYCNWNIWIRGNNARIINNKGHAESAYVSEGIYLLGQNARITGNSFSCQIGIFADAFQGIGFNQLRIQRNTINAEAVGIWLYKTSQSRIESNTLTGLTHTDYDILTNAYGIFANDSVNNLFYDNIISGSSVASSVGIGLDSLSFGNTLVLNKIDDAGTKIVDDGTGNIKLANWR